MRASLVLLAALLLGCTVSRSAGHGAVAQLVQQRTGQRTHWEQGSVEFAQVAELVGKLLQQGLTRERAIALVNNRALQATYEDLDISQAEVVQAGLLKNPSLSLGVGRGPACSSWRDPWCRTSSISWFFRCARRSPRRGSQSPSSGWRIKRIRWPWR